LTKEQYVTKVHDPESNQDVCLLAIQAGGYGMSPWIIGDTFMKNYYVHFDYEKKALGIAPAVPHNGKFAEDM